METISNSSLVRVILKTIENNPGLNSEELKKVLPKECEIDDKEWEAILNYMKLKKIISTVPFNNVILYYKMGPTKEERVIRERKDEEEKQKHTVSIFFILIVIAFVMIFLAYSEIGEYILYFGAIVVIIIVFFSWLAKP